MSYENPNRWSMTFTAHDFGAGDGTINIVGPAGANGKLMDYGVQNTTEVFNAVTTAATIAVGTAADPDAYGEEFSLGTTATASGLTVRSSTSVKSAIDAIIVDQNIPADTALRMTLTGPTGGTPTGIGQPFIVIDWEW